MSRDLPERPSLDHLRKQAELLLRELRRRDPDAKLTAAQHALAREYDSRIGESSSRAFWLRRQKPIAWGTPASESRTCCWVCSTGRGPWRTRS
jgi:hypothetical protein